LIITLDPAQIRRRSRLDPLRCYVSLRRLVEPHWYRSVWETNPWTIFESEHFSALQIECDETEHQRLLQLDEIPSAVTHEQIRVLYWLAREASAPGEIVELGSDQGKSTIALSWGSARNAHPCTVHAVDPFPGGESMSSSQRVDLFRSNLARLEAHSVILQQTFSGEYRRLRRQPVRLLFVDAAHDYLNSSHDFCVWRELISPGGFIAAHDVDNYAHGPGTRKAFFDCVLRAPQFRLVYHLDNLAVAQRLEREETPDAHEA
jgi:predicted O-methyltransferase YrrM